MAKVVMGMRSHWAVEGVICQLQQRSMVYGSHETLHKQILSSSDGQTIREGANLDAIYESKCSAGIAYMLQ